MASTGAVESAVPGRSFFGFHRNVFLMLTYTLGKGLQLSIGAISINLYAYSLGYRQEFIGLLAGMPSIGSFIAGVPLGMLADRIGRKPLIIAGAVLTPATLVAIALSTNAVTLLIASFLNGILASAYWVTNLAMLTESTTEAQRVRALSFNSFLLLGLGALGSLIGGVVPEIAGAILHQSPRAVEPLRLAVLSAAVVAALPAIPLFWLSEPRRDLGLRQHLSPAARRDEATHMAIAPAERRQMIALFAKLLIPDVLIVLGESAVLGLLQLFFTLRFNLEPGTLGVFLTIAGVFGGATALIAPQVVRRWGKLRTVVAMPLASVPIVLITGFVPVLGIAAVAEFFRNVFRGIFEPAYASFAMEQAPPRHRATLSGFYGVTWGVGYSLGAIIAGTLQQRVSLSAPFAIGGLCLGTASVLLLVFFGRR